MHYKQLLSPIKNNDPSISTLKINLKNNLIEILTNNQQISITNEQFRELSESMGKNYHITEVEIRKQNFFDLSQRPDWHNYIMFINLCAKRNAFIKNKKANTLFKNMKEFIQGYISNPIKASIVFVDEALFEGVLGTVLEIASLGFLYDLLRNAGPENLHYHISLPVVSIDNSLGFSDFYESITKSSIKIGFQDYEGGIFSILGVPSRYLCKIIGQAVGFLAGTAIATLITIPASIVTIINKIIINHNTNDEIKKIESEINKIDIRNEQEKQLQKSSRKAFVSIIKNNNNSQFSNRDLQIVLAINLIQAECPWVSEQDAHNFLVKAEHDWQIKFNSMHTIWKILKLELVDSYQKINRRVQVENHLEECSEVLNESPIKDNDRDDSSIDSQSAEGTPLLSKITTAQKSQENNWQNDTNDNMQMKSGLPRNF